MEDLDLVMSRLQGANLTLKKEKCYLFRTNVNFLRYTLCCKGVRPQTEKVEAIRRMGPPTTKISVTYLPGWHEYFPYLPPRPGKYNHPIKWSVKQRENNA